MIDYLTDKIDRIENDLPDDNGSIATGYLKKWLLAKYKRCLDRIRKVITGDIIKGNNPKEAIRFLNKQGDARSLIMAYGLMIDMQDYDEAQRLLDSIMDVNDDETIVFVKTQTIYLEYLQHPRSFILDDSDKIYLKSVGESVGTMTGFARAIYYDLTGIRITKNYGEHIPNTTKRNSTTTNISTQELKVFPNPNTTDILNVSFELKDSSEDLVSYRIFDITGKSNLLGKLSTPSASIDISSLSNSVYFIEVSAGDKKQITKFVKL